MKSIFKFVFLFNIFVILVHISIKYVMQGSPFFKIFTCPVGQTDGTLTGPNFFLMTMNQTGISI